MTAAYALPALLQPQQQPGRVSACSVTTIATMTQDPVAAFLNAVADALGKSRVNTKFWALQYTIYMLDHDSGYVLPLTTQLLMENT